MKVTTADLMWFFNEAEGALGLRAMNLEPSGGDRDASENAAKASRMADDALRWTAVAARLRTIGPQRERVLRLAYASHRWQGLERWYELAGVAAWLTNREDVLAAGRVVARLQTAEANAMRLRARRTLTEALVAFLGAP